MTDDHFKNIYAEHADLYERLVAREDMHGNIFATLMEIAPLDGIHVAEFGAGTGRLTRLLVTMAEKVYAFDEAPSMLEEARKNLEMTGMTNWELKVADNRSLPLPDESVDLAIEGWSFAHTVGWSPQNWREEIAKMLAEMDRVLRPKGTAILLETMGTGNKRPQPPNEDLATFYMWLEKEQGFHYKWIRTDYQFESLDEADELTRFFFGDEFADKVRNDGLIIVPECTGVWWKKYD